MKIAVGTKSDVGRVRQGNEDSFLAEDPVFAVADGMGGHRAGEVASATAIEVVRSAGDIGPDDLEQLIKEANSAIFSKAGSEPGLNGMGTTCTIVLIEGATAHLAHVGDSRAYLVREGKVDQITLDHTLVARLVREGRISAEEARHHPQRSVITRALGVDSEVKVDVLSHDLRLGDRLLICSDGLSSMVETGPLEKILIETDDPQETADRLVDLANESGGEDNITVVVLDAVEEGDSRPPRERTEEPAADPEELVENRPRGRRLLTFSLIALFAGVLWLGGQYALNNLMWFVGVDGTGHVAIFHGVPEEVGGLDLSNLAESTDLVAAELPQFARDDVEEGHRVGSLEEARVYVENIRDRASDFKQAQPSPTASPKR